MGWSDLIGNQAEIAVEGSAFRAVFLGNDPAGIFIGPFSDPLVRFRALTWFRPKAPSRA